MVTACLALAACESDLPPDLTPPHIELDNPKMGGKFSAGTYIPFNALFSDDQSLGTFSIDIHNAFDDHGHGRIAEDPELSKFSYKRNFELPPSTAHIIALPEEIFIPVETMAGPYHFIVQAIDAVGNATSFQDASNVEREIQITNASMARVDITNILNDELEIEADFPFIVEGTITDPPHPALQGFELVYIALGEPDEGHAHEHERMAENLFENYTEGSQLDPYYNQDGSLNLSKLINFTPGSQDLSTLQNEGVDHLVLTIEVHDIQGNITFELVPVHIHTN